MRFCSFQQNICGNLKGTINDKENTQGRIQLRPLQIQVSGKAIEQRIFDFHSGIVSDYYVAYVAAFV